MNNRTITFKPALIFALMLATGAPNAVAGEDENYLKLSEKLVELRGQVNDMSNELQQLRDEHKIEMRGLLSQKNSADSAIKNEDIVLSNLQEDLLSNKQLIKEVGADKETIKQALLIEVKKLENYIASGLPFKVEDRMRSLERYENNLNAGVLSSHKAANTLWSMIEDELKLARDNGVYRQSINVDGKEHLAHVVKLGMVMMYFRVGEDSYGMFRKNGDQWVAEVRQDSQDVEQIEKLFSSLEKQIHVGYFELPASF